MAVEIVFETHSLTEDNERAIATGWLGGRLSEKGRALAKELGGRRRVDTDAVFTSDLARATETANIAFGETAVRIYHDWRLRECNYGDLNGKPVAQVTAHRKTYISEPYPHGESFLQVVERVRSFLSDLAANWDGARVLVIAHSATKWSLDHLVDGTPLEELVEAPFEWKEGWTYRLGK